MTSDQFTYWLQGFTELHGEPPSAEQWQSIKDHLSLVFTKVTPTLQPAQRTDELPRQPSDSSVLWPNARRSLLDMPQCASGQVVGISDHASTRMYC